MSDQDFFFDDDEKTATEDKPKAERARSAQPSRGQAAAQAAVPVTAQSVSVTIAALMSVCALLVGVIIGLVIPSGPTAQVGGGTSGLTGGSGAPPGPLTPDQLSGPLPEGHPEIGQGSQGGTGAPGGSNGATGSSEGTPTN